MANNEEIQLVLDNSQTFKEVLNDAFGAEIIDDKNQIVSCVCGSQRFEVLPHHELTRAKDQMAFCTQCERGKALELWQNYTNLAFGFILKSDWLKKGKI